VSENEKYNVLIVDDEEVVLQVMQAHLAELPCRVIPTLSPAEAIHVLRTHEVAVLICDLNFNMPELNGNVVLAAARLVNPDTVPIVVSGAGDQQAIIEAINQGGIWKYIVKPWEKNELLTLVQTGLDHYAKLSRPRMELEELAHSIATKMKNVVGKHQTHKTRSLRFVKKKPHKKVVIRPHKEGVLDNRYRLGKIVGEGRSGTVYKAEDLLLRMPVAIKIINPRFIDDEFALSTLKTEARIAMRLSHKHIVRLHTLQKLDDTYFIVMEYVKGQTWRRILDVYGQLSTDSVIQVMRVCSDALLYAHRQGVIHKDMKPENLLLTNDGVLKIIDFGISCLTSAQTTTEFVIGTPAYMSPEQIRGEILDLRTDIYALGMIIHELITGKPVFHHSVDPASVLEAGPIELPDIPEDIRWVLEKAIAANPNDRWESVATFATAFVDAADPTSAQFSRARTEHHGMPQDSI
jgi:DNA-binding NarL/FixJ family response regulator